jgi:hypothetical protein
VANDDGIRNLEFTAEPSDIVRKGWYVVAVLGPVAIAAPTQIQRRHSVGRLEVVELRLEESVVAAPAMYEHERRLATSLLLVIQG